MRKLSLAMMCLAIAGLMTMVSCRKPNTFNGKKLTFKATIDNNGAKTTLHGDEEVWWSVNDEIRINGNEEVNLFKVKNINGDDKKQAEITGWEVNPVNEGYLASYPKSGSNNGEKVTFNIPDVQSENGTELSGKIPMVAWTTEKGGDLKFHNMVNILKLSLNGYQTINTIEVSSESENLNGSYTVSKVGDELKPAAISGSLDSQKTITLDDLGLNLSTGDKIVYVMLPVFANKASTISIKFSGPGGEQTFGPKALDTEETSNSITPSHIFTTADPMAIHLEKDPLGSGTTPFVVIDPLNP